MAPVDVRESAEGISFPVRVLPRSSRNEVAGVEAGRLRIRVTAPPVDGEANKACISVLAKLFRVRRGQVEIVNGIASRDKIVAIAGVGAAGARAVLESVEGGNTVGGL